MEFRRHELDADRHTICASSPRCGPNDLRFCHSKDSALRRVSTEPITWVIHGFGMGQRYSGHRRHPSITLRLLPVRCCFPIRMAGPIFLADSTANSISLPCGSGTAPIGRSYFRRLFRLLGLQRPLQRIRPRDRLLCLAVSLMLTRITPGPMMARHGLCNLRLCNLF